MNNIKPIFYQNAPSELLCIYDDILAVTHSNQVPNWASYLGANLPTLSGVWAIYKKIHLEGSIPKLLKELIIFSVSWKQYSPYCSEYHACNVLQFHASLSFDDLVDLVTGKSRGVLSEVFLCVLEIINELCQQRCSLSAEDYAKLFQAGFDDGEIIEIIGTFSLAMLLSSLTSTLMIPIDKEKAVAGFYSKNRNESE